MCVLQSRVGSNIILKNARKIKEWFNILGVSNEKKYRKIWNDELEERIIKRLWKEKENKCVDFKYKCKYVNKR